MTKKKALDPLEAQEPQPDLVRFRVRAPLIYGGKVYNTGESTIIERALAEEMAAAHPEAAAHWTDFAIEKAEEQARAAERDAAATAAAAEPEDLST